MKDINLLVWMTQLGLSVAVPLGGFILLAVWLRSRFGWGTWVIWVGLILGILSAIDGLRTSLHILNKMGRDKKKEDEPPAASFNDHD